MSSQPDGTVQINGSFRRWLASGAISWRSRTNTPQQRKEAKGEMSKRNDIMSALLAARDPKMGDKLTDSEVWGEGHLMIAAGMY